MPHNSGLGGPSLPRVDLPYVISKDFTEPVKVEIRGEERWTAGDKAPLQAFDTFRLPQDYSSYDDYSREEITLRCEKRGSVFKTDKIVALSVFSLFSLVYSFSSRPRDCKFRELRGAD